MKLDNKSCDYFTINQSAIASGVTKKIQNTVVALNNHGINTSLKNFDTGISGLFKLIDSLLISSAKLIIIRFTGINRTIILFPFIVLMRMKGHKVVLDLPTPLIVAMQEIRVTNSIANVVYRWIPILIFYPWVLTPYSRVVQSGYEHPYFTFLLKNKTKLVGNGINVRSIKPTIIYPSVKKKISILCVAQLEVWHGYDRLLHSVNSYFTNSVNPFDNFEILVIGDGNEKNNLENLSKVLGLNDIVRFKGNLTGDALDEVFQCANFAVSSLGSFRVNLKISSPLKSREYTARSIPFVSADSDPDFSSDLPFVLHVSNDDSEISFSNILDWYFNLVTTNFDFNEIRKYAELKLDFKNKVEIMFLN